MIYDPLLLLAVWFNVNWTRYLYGFRWVARVKSRRSYGGRYNRCGKLSFVFLVTRSLCGYYDANTPHTIVQQRLVRTIMCSPHRSHTEPLFIFINNWIYLVSIHMLRVSLSFMSIFMNENLPANIYSSAVL